MTHRKPSLTLRQLKTAKIENENDRIIELLAELMGKRQVVLNLSNDLNSSRNEKLSGRLDDPSERSLSQQHGFKNGEDSSSKINNAMKEALVNNTSVLSGSQKGSESNHVF